jgi:hypothetical protein
MQDDAKDAARWRWMREQHSMDADVNQWFIYGAHATTPDELDAEIDAAMGCTPTSGEAMNEEPISLLKEYAKARMESPAYKKAEQEFWREVFEQLEHDAASRTQEKP